MSYNENSQSRWTKARLLNLITNSHYDLFNDELNKPKPYHIKRWLNKYLKRETFRNKLFKTKYNDKNH